jgi:hypothetical protein
LEQRICGIFDEVLVMTPNRFRNLVSGNPKFNIAAAALVLSLTLGAARADIVWRGDFSTGDFSQWHSRGNPSDVSFHGVPAYGRPIQYGLQNPLHVGDGSLLSLVSVDGRTVNGIHYPQGPTRGAPYAAKVTVKNSANGTEPEDCDVIGCGARRTEVHMQIALMEDYGAMTYENDWWFGTSIFLPSDWPTGGSNWGPLLFQVKERNERSGGQPVFTIATRGNSWSLTHNWIYMERPTTSDIPWQQSMFYTGNFEGSPYPRANAWPEGMADFPNVEASHAALKSLNLGGWTDWIVHVRWDSRGSSATGPNGEPGFETPGQGFLSVWKREDSGPWVKVLHILPKWTKRGGMTFNHGIGYITPGGYGVRQGMYMDKNRVWDLPNNRVLYFANTKVGNRNSIFSDMTHDGSSPGAQVLQPPQKPDINPVE